MKKKSDTKLKIIVAVVVMVILTIFTLPEAIKKWMKKILVSIVLLIGAKCLNKEPTLILKIIK